MMLPPEDLTFEKKLPEIVIARIVWTAPMSRMGPAYESNLLLAITTLVVPRLGLMPSMLIAVLVVPLPLKYVRSTWMLAEARRILPARRLSKIPPESVLSAFDVPNLLSIRRGAPTKSTRSIRHPVPIVATPTAAPPP